MEIIIDISSTGQMTSLYNDLFLGLGEMNVNRASNVEFDPGIQRWTVEMFTGPYANACMMQTFKTRQEALDVEIDVLNQWILEI